MANMVVRVRPEMAEFVESEVARGGYRSASDVVDDALTLLEAVESERRAKVAALRHAIGLGLEDVEHGRFSTRTLADIRDEVLKGDRD